MKKSQEIIIALVVVVVLVVFFVIISRHRSAANLPAPSPSDTPSDGLSVASDPGGLPGVYKNYELGFSIRLPLSYTTDDTYTYQELGPGKDIHGVKFTIPETKTTGTNLSTDTY